MLTGSDPAGRPSPARSDDVPLTLLEAVRRALPHRGPQIDDPRISDNAAGLFWTAAETWPDRVAIRTTEGAITYSQLALKVRLISREVLLATARGDVVAVAGRRGPEVIASLLALMVTGRVYVPLDPSWPAERVHGVVRQCGATLVLHDANASEAARRAGVASIDLQRLLAGIPEALEAPESATTQAAGDDPAYIIFTSGSTGEPKGAVNTHAGLVNHLLAKVADLGLGLDDRVAQTAPTTFDISVWQMLAPFVVGAECVVLGDEVVKEPPVYLDALQREAVTVLEVVPSLMYPLLEEIRREVPLRLALRWLLLGGEAVKPSLCKSWLALFPDVPVMNVYGPTECADDITHHVVKTASDLTDGYTPIGRPLRNTTLYVLRHDGTGWLPCGPDEVGELVAGGVGVGLGYVNDETRTAEAFAFDCTTAGERFYRTGDLVSVDEHGVFTCLGRRDRQVKIRGHRVELEEIEVRLLAMDGVSQAAVVVRQQEVAESTVTREQLSGEPPTRYVQQSLVAFVVSSVEANSVREAAARHLPAIMVPDQVVVVESIPVVSAGKTDHAALLRRLDHATTTSPDWLSASPLWEAVAQVWYSVVGRYPLSPSEEPTHAGVDSLQAMILGVRLSELSGTTIRTAAVMSARSFADLADLTDGALTRGALSPAGASVGNAKEAADLTERRVSRMPHQQEGVWFHWQLDPASSYYTYQGYMDIHGVAEDADVLSAWGSVVRRHPHLAGRVLTTPSGVRLEFPMHDLGVRKVHDLSGDQSPAAAFRRAAEAAVQVPFDLDDGPMLRAEAYRLGASHVRLLLTMNELVLDGWAADVLTQEVAAEIRAATGRQGTLGHLRDESLVYQRYADEQHERRDSRTSQESLEYWRRVFSSPVPAPGVVVPAPELGESYAAGLLQRRLTEDVSRGVVQLARDLSVTPYSVLLAALWITLASRSGSRDIVVGSPATHRPSSEAQRVTAFLVTMLSLRAQVDESLTVSDLVKLAGEKIRAGLDHADVPFSDVVRTARTTGALGRRQQPFDVMLNVLNFPAAPSSAEDGTSVVFRELWTGYSKYSLSFYAQVRQGAFALELAWLRSCFTEDQAAEILDEYLLNITSAVTSPHQRLDGLLVSTGHTTTTTENEQVH